MHSSFRQALPRQGVTVDLELVCRKLGIAQLTFIFRGSWSKGKRQAQAIASKGTCSCLLCLLASLGFLLVQLGCGAFAQFDLHDVSARFEGSAGKPTALAETCMHHHALHFDEERQLRQLV